MNKTNIFRLGLSLALLFCLLDMPYGYYQFVRFVGMASFGYMAFTHYEKEEREWMIFWAASAVLINPFIKISIGRGMWNIVDVIWAGVLVYQVYMDWKTD